MSSIKDTIISVLGAAFGVQSNERREKDFQDASYKRLIVGGIVFTALFVATLVLIVRWAITHLN